MFKLRIKNQLTGFDPVDKLKALVQTAVCRVVESWMPCRSFVFIGLIQLNSPSTYNINPPPGTSMSHLHIRPSLSDQHSSIPSRMCIKWRFHLFQSLVSVPPNSAMLEASSTKHRRQRHLKPREHCKCSRRWSTSRFRKPGTGVSCHVVPPMLQVFHGICT